MIETSQTVVVGANVDQAWSYVQDIRRWAELMPGLQDCEIIDENNSRWILKVGVGALVRTVKVNVHVDQWDGPHRAAFSYSLQGDPVKGSGSYQAVPTGSDSMQMTLELQVKGSGPMAPMWEAMGAPLLPKFALTFAEQLAEGITAAQSKNGQAANEEAKVHSGGFSFFRWLWSKLFKSGHNQQAARP